MSAGSNESCRPRTRSVDLVGRQPLGRRLLAAATRRSRSGSSSRSRCFELLDADAAAVLQGDAQHRLLRAARPQVDGVDGVARTAIRPT